MVTDEGENGMRETVWQHGPGISFHARIDPTDDGQVMAPCYARREILNGHEEQEPDRHMFPDEETAGRWINSVGACRGFPSVFFRKAE
jgi:hypothetical protein